MQGKAYAYVHVHVAAPATHTALIYKLHPSSFVADAPALYRVPVRTQNWEINQSPGWLAGSYAEVTRPHSRPLPSIARRTLALASGRRAGAYPLGVGYVCACAVAYGQQLLILIQRPCCRRDAAVGRE